MNDPRKLVDVPVHPVADLFPMMSETEFSLFVNDISAKGQLVPILMHNGTMLDGRNRYAACKVVKRPPVFVEFDGSEHTATEYIISLNARRRHLTEDRVVAICAEALPHYRKEAAERKKAAQFKKGQSGNPSGKTKRHLGTVMADTFVTCGPEQVNPKSGRPARDYHSSSAVGQVAKAAGVSRYKVEKKLGKVKPKKKKPVRDCVLDALRKLYKKFGEKEVKTILRGEL